MKNTNNKAKDYCLVWRIQSGMINLMSNKMKEIIIDTIWKNKFYSVQLNCTRDKSHVERLTLSLCIVDLPGKKTRTSQVISISLVLHLIKN